MNVELKLWCDQSDMDEDNTESSVWELYVNGQAFPSGSNHLVSLARAHQVASRLCDIEELIHEDI